MTVPPARAALTADWIVRNAAERQDRAALCGLACRETYKAPRGPPWPAASADAPPVCAIVAPTTSSGASSAPASRIIRLDFKFPPWKTLARAASARLISPSRREAQLGDAAAFEAVYRPAVYP